MALTNVTWTNNRVALTNDLIFGVSVFTESGWLPLSLLGAEDVEVVRALVNHNPSCPWLEELYM